MDSVTRDNWERFYDRVVVRGRHWPRSLWFAAVEDGLRAGLSAQSPLLAQYRQDVAELAELERAGAPRDGGRQQQLEGEIKRLIAIADQSIRESGDQAGRAQARNGFRLGALTLSIVVFCGALLGLTYHQQQRARERMQLEFAALQQRLMEQAADQRSALEARIGSIERVREDLGALQAELRAKVVEFDRLVSASAGSPAAAGDSALPDPGRQGLDQEGATPSSALQERAAALKRQLEQVEGSLAVLAEQLPDLDGGASRLAERLETTRAALERVEGQVATIQAQAPDLALWLEGQRRALAQDLESRGAAIGALGAEITALQGALEDSRGQLVEVTGPLEQDLARIKQHGDNLEQTLGQVRTAEQEASELIGRVDAAFATTRDAAQQRLDALLAEVAGQAERAVQRTEEAMRQAEAAATRRLETATGQAIEELDAAREAQLAELETRAAEVRAELERTRAALIADWRGMDEAVGERHAKALANLDQYAATLELRVQELLEALDVIVARSSG